MKPFTPRPLYLTDEFSPLSVMAIFTSKNLRLTLHCKYRKFSPGFDTIPNIIAETRDIFSVTKVSCEHCRNPPKIPLIDTWIRNVTVKKK